LLAGKGQCKAEFADDQAKLVLIEKKRRRKKMTRVPLSQAGIAIFEVAHC
jgi:hypothetical protein